MVTKSIHVIFLDKKKFNLDGLDGYRCYWRHLRKDPIGFSHRDFGGGSLMVWGTFCRSQELKIAFVSCRMDSEEYQTVLRFHLLPFLRGRRPRNYVFQQDNAFVHASRSTKKWSQDSRFGVIDWSVCSPDLSPTKNMWGTLAREVYMDNRQFQDVEGLKAAVGPYR